MKRPAALVSLAEKTKDRDDAAYFAYLQAVAERLSGQGEPARDTLRKALQGNPAGRSARRSSVSSWRPSSWRPATRRGRGAGSQRGCPIARRTT